MLPQDAVAGMPVQNKAIPDDNGIQQPPFVENVLLKLLFFFKIQGRDLALKFRVDFKRSQLHHQNALSSYRMEQDLLFDAEYKRNGYEYTTDHLGRLFTAEGDLHLKENDGRLQIKDNIHDIGKGYEKSTDDRGHAIADRFDGANDLENLVPQDAGLNRNEFKNFESKLAQELEAEKQVYLKLEMHYPGDSFRPDTITAETTIDGRQEVKVFLNDKY